MVLINKPSSRVIKLSKYIVKSKNKPVLAMVTSLFLVIIVYFHNFIAQEDGWLESITEILMF